MLTIKLFMTCIVRPTLTLFFSSMYLLLTTTGVVAQEFQYDDLNRIEQVEFSNGDKLIYSYDNSGNITKKEITYSPRITISDPSSNPSWEAGSTQTIRWVSKGADSSDVTILLLSSGSLDSEIGSTVNDGEYEWQIPNNQTPGSDYKIRISSISDPSINDTSESFSIVAAPVMLESIAISGVEALNENTSTSYSVTANYSDDSSQLVSNGVIWGEDSNFTVINNNGVLSASNVAFNETVTIQASYSLNGVTKTASKIITVIDTTDSDQDGVLDSQDNCPSNANANQSNNDGDDKGNVCDPDDDNDGMPDVWELANGLNPFDPSDRNLDPDGDGRNNIKEYRDRSDPNLADEAKPVIIPPIIQLLLDEDIEAVSELNVKLSAKVTGGNDPVPHVITDDSLFLRQGYAYIDPLFADSVKGTNNWTNYAFTFDQSISTVGTSIRLKARFKSLVDEGAHEARDVTLMAGEVDPNIDQNECWMLCVLDGQRFHVTLMGDSWGQSYTSAGVFELYQRPFLEAVVDMQDWSTIELVLNSGSYRVIYNGNEIKSFNYEESAEHKVNGFAINFKGSGKLDFIEIDRDGQILFNEDFGG